MVKPPTIAEIMVKHILYFDPEYSTDWERICENEDIDLLPSFDLKTLHCLNMQSKQFEAKPLTYRMKVAPTDTIFGEEVVEKILENQLLFVFDDGVGMGVVHFSDYNQDKVLVFLYQTILEFEKDLRKMLEIRGVTREDVFESISDEAKKARVNHLLNIKASPLSIFELSTLLAFTENNFPIVLGRSIVKTRNRVMHFGDMVKKATIGKKSKRFDLHSFRGFIGDVRELLDDQKRLRNYVTMLEMERATTNIL